MTDTNPSSQLTIEQVDEVTQKIYLDVPSSKIVLLQAIFELHEGIGTVRTLDARQSLICIFTPNQMLDTCLELLESIRDIVPWRPTRSL